MLPFRKPADFERGKGAVYTMAFTASEAAKEVGKSLPTITKAISSGKLSASGPKGGPYSIEPAELFRVWPRVEETPLETSKLRVEETPSLGAENKGLERLVTTLQEQLAHLRNEHAETVADLRADRDQWRGQADRWQQQAERLTLMLPAPVNAPAPEPAQPVTVEAPALGQGRSVGGFWARLWGKVPSND